MDQLDRQLAAKARMKIAEDKKPTAREAAALKRVLKRERAEITDEIMGACPKSVFLAHAGQSAHQIKQRDPSLEIPTHGALVNLGAAFRAIYAVIDGNKDKLTRTATGLPISGHSNGQATPIDRWHEVKAQREELRLEREAGELVDVQDIRVTLDRWSLILRQAGSTLERQCGKEARAIFDEALDECDRVVADMKGND